MKDNRKKKSNSLDSDFFTGVTGIKKILKESGDFPLLIRYFNGPREVMKASEFLKKIKNKNFPNHDDVRDVSKNLTTSFRKKQ